MRDLFRMYEQRNRDRAQYWASVGRPDYARGSLRKAHKWQQKLREFEYSIYGAYPKTRIEDLLDEHMREVEKKFSAAFVEALYGDAR